MPKHRSSEHLEVSRISPADALPDVVERLVSRRQYRPDDGDVLIIRERVSDEVLDAQESRKGAGTVRGWRNPLLRTGGWMSFVPLRLAAGVSPLKNRVVQRRVQATAAALILSASLDVEAQTPILGPYDAIGVDYPDRWFTEQAIARFEVQYNGGQWTPVGIPPVYAASDGVTTYSVKPTMSAGNHAVSFRVCNAGGCSTSTSPFTFLVPAGGNPPGVGTGPVVPLQALQASHTDNKCLDVSESSTENGSTVIQWQCHGGDNQAWRIELPTTATTRGWSRVRAASAWTCVASQWTMGRLSSSGSVTAARTSSGDWKPSTRDIDSLRATAASAWMLRGGRLTMAQPLFSGSVTAVRTRHGLYASVSALGSARDINTRE